MNHADQFIDVGDIRLRYRIDGDGDWLVLVHGVGGSLEQWDQFVDLLGGRFRTLRYDQRGHGQSSKPEGPYLLDDFINDLDRLLTGLGVARCHLAGCSLGGLVAQGYALAHQDRIDRLVLLAAIAGRTETEKARVMERLAIVANGIPGQHFESSVDRWFTDEFRAAHPEIIAAYAERNRRNDPKAYAAAYRVLATTDLVDRLHEIRVPTLIATGENDRGSNPRMARIMHECIANSELVIFPKLRHSLLIEAPDKVVEVVEPFLRTVRFNRRSRSDARGPRRDSRSSG